MLALFQKILEPVHGNSLQGERDSVGGRHGAVRYELCSDLINTHALFMCVCRRLSVLLHEILCDPSISVQKVECQATMDALTYQQTLMRYTPVSYSCK